MFSPNPLISFFSFQILRLELSPGSLYSHNVTRGFMYPPQHASLTEKLQFSVKGITAQLDYLKELGIDIVWVSPSQFQ